MHTFISNRKKERKKDKERVDGEGEREWERERERKERQTYSDTHNWVERKKEEMTKKETVLKSDRGKTYHWRTFAFDRKAHIFKDIQFEKCALYYANTFSYNNEKGTRY